MAISEHLEDAGLHAASLVKEKYDDWHAEGWQGSETEFKQNHFTIAVGGGNTVKAEYRALLEQHAFDIDWIDEVRFFFLEESSGEPRWESARDSLVDCFIRPLAGRLVARYGRRRIANRLELDRAADESEITAHLIDTLTFGFDLSQAKKALASGDREKALELAHSEARRYRAGIVERLGRTMAFHMIISGIGKDGGLGAFAPYTPALREKKPGITVIEQGNGTLRVASNRGVLIGAECVSLIISGNLKLKALGRFEMEESTPFETTVMETPLRMLRQTREIAEKVYIFADDRALHFDEGVFQFRANGDEIRTKAEVRPGSDADGVHVLLLHGFMGLYSFINFLIRLPSAWTVSALHRGSEAKRLPDQQVFPHYAKVLRKVILKNWKEGRPTPTGYHSIAGVISDHLLLSVTSQTDGPLPEFEDLKKQDQMLVEALRSGGMIHLASWAPSDVVHILKTGHSLVSHVRSKTRLDYGGPSQVYQRDSGEDLKLNSRHDATDRKIPGALSLMVKLPTTEAFINAVNTTMRFAFRKAGMQQRMSNREIPYALRLVGSRLLKKVSFYGLLKEIDAALHDSHEYQRRHLRALDIILKYDIPFLSIIHKDDTMVSANRHREEHEHMVARRMEKEGVIDPEELSVPTRFVLLERDSRKLPIDPLNPHLMIMSTSQEGDRLSREVTGAVTRFVNENVAAAIEQGKIKPLPSIARWVEENP
ncbi:MAG: hypothetical protein GY944_17090 [bacterium]|nr:hypothetical protein [bacterium]